MWSCSRETNPVPNRRLRRYASLFIRSTRPGCLFPRSLACIEDPRHTALGQWLADAFALPLVSSVGYETPGSFGSWCADLSLHCITAEFPPISSDEASEKYLRAMTDLLRWQPQR